MLNYFVINIQKIIEKFDIYIYINIYRYMFPLFNSFYVHQNIKISNSIFKKEFHIYV